MTGEFGGIGESVGDIVTGGLAARAIERNTGETGSDGHTHEGACLNCGTPLTGPYCHECGQRAHVHRTLSAFFHDLLHGVLHFEGKTWRTIPMLAWKPGKLTREYIDGKRARYVSPIALFLFVVFLSYALFSLLGGTDAFSPEVTGLDQARGAYATNEKTIGELREQLVERASDSDKAAEIEGEIEELEKNQKALEMVVGGVGEKFEKGFREGFEENPLPKGSSIAKTWDEVTENPQLTVYKLQTNAYKFSWMLIPLSVPFVWLLFPFSRRFRGYDHTVFTTYSITFMITLVAVSSLFFFFDMAAIGGLVLLYAPYHMYRQLRGTYDTSRFGALWRMLALSTFAWIAIGLFVAVLGWMATGH